MLRNFKKFNEKLHYRKHKKYSKTLIGTKVTESNWKIWGSKKVLLYLVEWNIRRKIKLSFADRTKCEEVWERMKKREQEKEN